MVNNLKIILGLGLLGVSIFAYRSFNQSGSLVDFNGLVDSGFFDKNIENEFAPETIVESVTTAPQKIVASVLKTIGATNNVIYKTSRGIRNHNPGNIERNNIKWQGMSVDQSNDNRFIVFNSSKWGIRALARVLKNYQNRRGLNTVNQIINRWAPPFENKTSSYAAVVARAVGVGINDNINVNNLSVLLPMVNAIIKHENGVNPYPQSVVLDGVKLA